MRGVGGGAPEGEEGVEEGGGGVESGYKGEESVEEEEDCPDSIILALKFLGRWEGNGGKGKETNRIPHPDIPPKMQ